jgi:hypothetical protein
MKVLEKGTPTAPTWTAEVLCTGVGTGGGGCGAKLLIEKDDVVAVPHPDGHAAQMFAFCCPECGVETGIASVPSFVRSQARVMPAQAPVDSGETARLIARMTEARIAVEAIRPPSHRGSCPIEDDTSYAPCNCGASDVERAIEKAKTLLRV